MTTSSQTQILSDQDATIRDRDIQALLEAGVGMIQLEDLYGAKTVHRVAETYITSTVHTDDELQHSSRRSKLATLLFLRAPSSSLQSIMKSKDVVDAVFEALVADPDDPLLMDPLLHTPLHDPVVLSSGIIVDRSTAIDPISGKLRLTKCPYRRIPLQSTVYEIYPLQEKIRAWEHSRLERCVSVVQTMMKEKDYERVERCFEIANGFLKEHQQRLSSSSVSDNNLSNLILNPSNTTTTANNINNNASLGKNVVSTNGNNVSQTQSTREILLLALQLAQLEREIPGVKDDIPRTVRIHQRLILVASACSTDKEDIKTLIIACLEDCWKRCSMLLAFAGKNASEKALSIRHSFAPLIKYTILMQLNLTEELQKLCHLDLTLAKHVDDEKSIWNCRRVLLKLLPEKEKAAFLQEEGITGNEDELYYHLIYDASLWRQECFVDSTIGLVHFGNSDSTESQNDTSGSASTQNKGVLCKVNLNPRPKGDHWIEVAFRPDNIQSPGHLNSILSQHGDGTGWEIRCAVRPQPHFVWGFGSPKVLGQQGGIHVEAVWTTTNGRGGTQHNEFVNPKVPLEIGTWYHVVLAFCHESSTLSLYVNGEGVRRTISGDFVPASSLPKMGENMQWNGRRFQGWVAFAGGGYELPVVGKDESALDEHVRRLAKARLSKLPRQPASRQPKIISEDESGSEDLEDSSGVGEDSSCIEDSSAMEDSSGVEEDHSSESDSE